MTPQRLVTVLPTTGEFDSRTYRIASGVAARGHRVTVIARWSFAPTPTAIANLRAVGIMDGVHLVGDVMQDLVARIVPELRALEADGGPGPTGCYLFATIHRAENRERIAGVRAHASEGVA